MTVSIPKLKRRNRNYTDWIGKLATDKSLCCFIVLCGTGSLIPASYDDLCSAQKAARNPEKTNTVFVCLTLYDILNKNATKKNEAELSP
jgi:hypothetical protein